MIALDTRLISKKDGRYLVSLCGPWERAKDLPRLIGVVYDVDDDQWLSPINLDRILSRTPWQQASVSDEEEFARLLAQHPIPAVLLQQGAQMLEASLVPTSISS